MSKEAKVTVRLANGVEVAGLTIQQVIDLAQTLDLLAKLPKLVEPPVVYPVPAPWYVPYPVYPNPTYPYPLWTVSSTSTIDTRWQAASATLYVS